MSTKIALATVKNAVAKLESAERLSADLLEQRRLERRAVEAAIWGMPIVAFEAMRRAFFSAGAQHGDFLYFSKPADWKLQITTPNASALYVYFNFNTKDGPVVLDFPPAIGAGLFGSILDAWQTALEDVGPEGEDRGRGAKYVILPPGFKGEVPPRAVLVRPTTYNGYGAFRAIPLSPSQADHDKAIELVRSLRLYPLAQAANPRPSKFIDIAGKLFDGIAKMDDTFFDGLAKMVSEEPLQTRDLVAMGQLRAIGIEKNKPFAPDATTRAILNGAAAEAHAGFMALNSSVTPYWPKARWGHTSYAPVGAKTAFSFQTENGLDVDGRGAMFFLACAGPKRVGAASLYLVGSKDASGAPLDGGKSYRLHVPPKVPAKQFWAVTVYDLETAAFFREAPSVEVNSYHDLQKNPDGSVDVFFGPKAPTGKTTNWIYTAPGKPWITFFRFYGPEDAIRDKSWTMGDIELTS